MLISECYVKYCQRSLFADLQVTTLDRVTQSIATIIEIRCQWSHSIVRSGVNRLTLYREISSCHFLYIDRDTSSYTTTTQCRVTCSHNVENCDDSVRRKRLQFSQIGQLKDVPICDTPSSCALIDLSESSHLSIYYESKKQLCNCVKL